MDNETLPGSPPLSALQYYIRHSFTTITTAVITIVIVVVVVGDEVCALSAF